MQTTLKMACRSFLPELIRLLLPADINCKEFITLAKEAYIDVARADHGRNGRPASISKVSRLTGLTRIDIRNILATAVHDDSQSQTVERIYLFTNLLRDWHHDTFLTDANGEPIVLPLTGTGASFESLVRRYFPKTSVVEILNELAEVGAVRIDEENDVQVLRDFYIPNPGSDESAKRVGSVLSDFLSTVVYNFYRSNQELSRIESRTTQRNVPVTALPEFRSRLETEITAVYQRLDIWLGEQVDDSGQTSTETVRAGFGVYQIETKQ